MNVFANTVVSLVFKLYDERNQVIEETSDPIAYLHGGYSGILPKVEAALNFRNVGGTVSVTLEPADAFGDYYPELIRLEPVDLLPPDVAVGGYLVADENGTASASRRACTGSRSRRSSRRSRPSDSGWSRPATSCAGPRTSET